MVIESHEDLEYFYDKISSTNYFILPIFLDKDKHPKNNKLSVLYFWLVSTMESFIVPFIHSDARFEIDQEDFFKKINTTMKKHTVDKKKLLHAVKLDNLYDMNLMKYLVDHSTINTDIFFTTAHTFYHREYNNRSNVNGIIPILKHLEYADNIRKYCCNILKPSDASLENYNNLVIETLTMLENNGISCDFDKLQTYFPTKRNHKTDGKYIFSEYNIYTSTGRPSNRFGGINFAALNKDNGERSIIQSRFGCDGVLVEFDYESFHVRLIADMVGFSFPEDTNVHDYLGKQYFGKDVLSKKDHDESKSITFRQLYGGIMEEFKNILFFKVVDEYIYSTWDTFLKTGSIESNLFNRSIKREYFNGITKYKLWNYILQLQETEQNILTLRKLLDYTENTKSKLVLYTYDSFLFDMNVTEGKDFITSARSILEDKFPVTMRYGSNYHDMKKGN